MGSDSLYENLALMRNNPVKVPVLMFHSVADHKRPRHWSFLSMPTHTFELCVRYLCNRNFNTISLKQLYKYMKYNTPLPPKPIVLTFDDGFLDNWVYAYPILKKYGMNGVIFVNPDFVDSMTKARPNLEDVWRGRKGESDLEYWGYLSWEEMRRMERDGTMEIQSHAMTHTWYFKDDNIIDFHHPGDEYYWLYWNEFPQKKAKWLIEYKEDEVPFGTPVYSYEKALITRRYFDDAGLKNHLVEYIAENGGENFFNASHWRSILHEITDDYRTHHRLNEHYETEQEYFERVRFEIFESKRKIEENLDKPVEFICWPGGGFNEITLKLATEAGYLASTKGTIRNTYGVDSSRIHRVSAPHLNYHQFGWPSKYATLLLFVIQVEGYRRSKLYDVFIQPAKGLIRRHNAN